MNGIVCTKKYYIYNYIYIFIVVFIFRYILSFGDLNLIFRLNSMSFQPGSSLPGKHGGLTVKPFSIVIPIYILIYIYMFYHFT